MVTGQPGYDPAAAAKTCYRHMAAAFEKARVPRARHNRQLPQPPTRNPLPDSVPPADALQQQALDARPELYALGAQIRQEEASLALAEVHIRRAELQRAVGGEL